MSFAPGSRLGPYEVGPLIGAGGMGEVYRARDTKLNRDVALKVLSDAFAQDVERMARFQREAQVLASLNHPNIGAIHGLEDGGETPALVLELVEGPTLADRIAEGPIPVDEALPIAKQIAEALEAAHELGIIHRDLKPANIKLRPDGTVKVLDFGLAKLHDGRSPGTSVPGSPDQANSPTLTAAASQMGVVMGTAAYMSPEQARGKAVDRRADIWAFGVVLYEMLTGQRPFPGDNLSATLARVIERDPDWAVLPENVPPVLAGFLRRCLAKEPKKRIRDIGDVALALDGAFEGPDRGDSAPASASALRVWQKPTLLAAASVLLLMIGALGGRVLMQPGNVVPDVARFSIVPPEAAPISLQIFSRDLAISADGTTVAYNAGFGVSGSADAAQLYLRSIGDAEPIPLRGAEGFNPIFSPDGRWVGFYDGTGSLLQKVPITGGPPVTLVEYPGVIRGKTWGTDDHVVFGTMDGGLFRVAGAGGDPEALTTVDTAGGVTSHTWPFAIPDHNAVLFVESRGSERETGQIAVLDLTTREIVTLGLRGTSPHYTSTGHLVFATADGTVQGLPFDPTTFTVTANPIPLIENVTVKDSGAANFSVSGNGSLVYVPGGAEERVLVWVDRDGREEPVDTAARGYGGLRLSPDGQQVAYTLLQGGTSDVVVHDLERDIPTRLTFENGPEHPIWTPDGQRVVFRTGATAEGLWWKAADGTGEAERLTAGPFLQWPLAWSADGSTLVIVTAMPETGPDIGLVSMDGDRDVELLISEPASQIYPHVSSDGRWIAYQSDESGQPEIYVRPFRNVQDGKWQISRTGGTHPLWAPDTRELFFRRPDDTAMMVVPIDTSAGFSYGNPSLLFEGTRYSLTIGLDRAFDLAPDGQRFLMLTGGAVNREIAVVLNWHEELKARVPVP